MRPDSSIQGKGPQQLCCVLDGTVLFVESLVITFFLQVWGHFLLQGTRHDFENLPKHTSAGLSLF